MYLDSGFRMMPSAFSIISWFVIGHPPCFLSMYPSFDSRLKLTGNLNCRSPFLESSFISRYSFIFSFWFTSYRRLCKTYRQLSVYRLLSLPFSLLNDCEVFSFFVSRFAGRLKLTSNLNQNCVLFSRFHYQSIACLYSLQFDFSPMS